MDQTLLYHWQSDSSPLSHLLLLPLNRFSLVRLRATPIDGRPPGSAIPGIPQARTLEWIAISFSNAWNWKVKVKSWQALKVWCNLSVKSPGIGNFFGGDLNYEFSFLDSYEAIQFSISYCVSCNSLGFWGTGSFDLSLQINICIVTFSIILFPF